MTSCHHYSMGISSPNHGEKAPWSPLDELHHHSVQWASSLLAQCTSSPHQVKSLPAQWTPSTMVGKLLACPKYCITMVGKLLACLVDFIALPSQASLNGSAIYCIALWRWLDSSCHPSHSHDYDAWCIALPSTWGSQGTKPCACWFGHATCTMVPCKSMCCLGSIFMVGNKWYLGIL